MIRLVLLWVLIVTGITYAGGQNSRLVFSPHWMPQAQFAGYYVALDQGFYAEKGLDVEIIHPSATVNALTFLEGGRADLISLFLVTALEAARKGVDLVNIAQLSQHSAIVFVSKTESGIESIEDFDGKKLGIWMSGFQEVPEALMAERNIKPQWVPVMSTVNLFLLGGIDIMTVMWYNEYNQIYLSGVDHDELNSFFLSDYGYDIPEDGIYALRQTLGDRPDALSAFVEASLKGWEHARANREYAVDLVVDLMRKAHIPSNKAHQSWMLDKVLDMQQTSGKEGLNTLLRKEDFEKTRSIIESVRNTSFPLEYRQFFQPVIPFTEADARP
jgi:NitT/TauT family transport system substrate-binding protein